MDQIFNGIENSSPKIKYIYFIIPLVTLFLFTKFDIKLNVLVALLIAALVIIYVNYQNQLEQTKIENIYNIKQESIRPKSVIINKYNEYVDLLFSIQDIYAYNPPAYENLIENLEIFLELYEEAKIANELAGLNYGLADVRQSRILNNLHSIIYNIPTNRILIDKLNRAVAKLDDMTDLMLNEMITINKNHIESNGYTRDSVVIVQGPKESNYYEKDSFNLY